MKKRIVFLVLSLILAFGFTACTTKETATAEELVQQENDIISDHQALWNIAFGAVDENSDEFKIEDYAEFLTKAVDNVKDKLNKEDFKTLTEDIEKIRALEKQIAALPQTETSPTDDTFTAIKKFPAFQGKDFDGNTVDETLFSNNTVTLVNFWFNGCSPCVAELPALQQLNESLKEKGGAVVGINVETLDENKDPIETAKEIMKKQGASYQNIYFDADSEAGKLSASVMSFPTTILIDKEGNIVGEPIVGSLESEKAMADVQEKIDAFIAR